MMNVPEMDRYPWVIDQKIFQKNHEKDYFQGYQVY